MASRIKETFKEIKETPIIDVIKYEGDNSTFVWKHPCEDFNTKTQLIVHESQEAIFLLNGQAADTFGPGRYTLDTQNLPILSTLLKNFVTGGESMFHCEVYFINKTVQMAFKWGTDSKVRFLDPTMGIPLEIGACGELNLAVCDSRKLLTKLVGTMNGIAWGDVDEKFTKSLQSSFRPMISTAVKANIANSIKSNNINLLEIDENLELLSEALRKSVNVGFEEYGLTVPQFYVTNVLLPESDPLFRRMKELHTISFQAREIQADAFVKTARADADAEILAAQRKAILEGQTTETEIARREAERELIKAQADAQANRLKGLSEADVMIAKGYTQKDVLQADVQKAYAEGIGNMTINGGSGGSVAGDMIGMTMGMAAASVMAPQMNEMFKGVNPTAPTTNASPTPEAPAAKCAACGANLPANAKFCLECGEKVAPAVPVGMIVCPSCGETVAKGKFCPECGHKFVTACPACGSTVAPGAKFCPECGEKL